MFARFSNMFNNAAENESPKPNGASCASTEGTPQHNSQHYQINNSSSVLQKIANLYAERLMSDIVLVVGSHEFSAHRLILCASSDVFQVMLMNPHWNESREQRIVLQESTECVAVFELFLRYLYTGQLRVSHNSVLPVLTLADKYNIKELIDTCGDYMREHVVTAAQQNFLMAWLQYAIACGHTKVAQICVNHFKWNFEQVAATEDFQRCDLELLTTVLSQNDLVVHDEMTLYSIAVKWLLQQEELSASSASTPVGDMSSSPATTPVSFPVGINHPSCIHRGSVVGYIDRMEWLVYEVMKFVRFPMMSPRQMAELLLVPLTIKYKEFFVLRMAIGMYFHSGQWERVRSVACDPDPSNRLLFVPRLYTADQWSSALIVDNLPALPSYHTRTLVFSTPFSASDSDCCDSQLEWIVELYPKGVWFRKFSLIIWQGTLEVPEAVLRTVRLAVTAKDVERPARVRVSVLVYGAHTGSREYVVNVVSRKYIFTADDNLLNLDDVLPFDSLNDTVERQRFLQKPCESLKIHVVISPLPDPKLGCGGVT